MSSLEWTAYSITRDTLKQMAREGVFTSIGDEDTLRGISEEAIIGRFQPKPKEERGTGNQGESRYSLPGIHIAWVGHDRPESAGEIDFDDGIITMLVQIVDRLDRSEDNNIESYMRWQTDIREWLQKNPYRDLSKNIGEIYFVHVTETVSLDNRSFIADEARLVQTVKLFTRSRRDIGVRNYDT